MKYRGLTVNFANIGLDMRIDMGLEVFVSKIEAGINLYHQGLLLHHGVRSRV